MSDNWYDARLAVKFAATSFRPKSCGRMPRWQREMSNRERTPGGGHGRQDLRFGQADVDDTKKKQSLPDIQIS